MTNTRHLHFFCKMANVYYYYCFLLFTILFSEINSQPTDYYLNQKADYFPYNFVRPQLNSLGNYPTYSELCNKHGACFEKTTCAIIKTSMFIHFWSNFQLQTYKIILTSFKHSFCCFNHFKVNSKSQTKPE